MAGNQSLEHTHAALKGKANGHTASSGRGSGRGQPGRHAWMHRKSLSAREAWGMPMTRLPLKPAASDSCPVARHGVWGQYKSAVSAQGKRAPRADERGERLTQKHGNTRTHTCTRTNARHLKRLERLGRRRVPLKDCTSIVFQSET